MGFLPAPPETCVHCVQALVEQQPPIVVALTPAKIAAMARPIARVKARRLQKGCIFASEVVSRCGSPDGGSLMTWGCEALRRDGDEGSHDLTLEVLAG